MQHPLIKHLRSEMMARRDMVRAEPMAAYMKNIQPFLGIASPVREDIIKSARKVYAIESRDIYRDIIFELWNGEFREEKYMALEVAQRYKSYLNADSFDIYEKLVYDADWWDTLDWLAGKIVGPIVQKHREFEENLIQWRIAENLWTRRAALLTHLKHKKHTNIKLLSETIELLAPETDFFIRKAIGWVLREYSKTDSQWVINFVKSHEKTLSNLSKREALKVVERQKDEK
ncbi:MAG: DNA alkylation repair protein [Calditrichaeota bacterium]|nr:DNA alkylation repair protein [Calditrichota bacterium]MCB9069157.1 DNA alkylation repair protein [Calditrichia bacterium]